LFIIKVGPTGEINHIKAIQRIGYTFCPVAKMTTVPLFFPMAAICHWSLYQLDVESAFPHEDLEEAFIKILFCAVHISVPRILDMPLFVSYSLLFLHNYS